MSTLTPINDALTHLLAQHFKSPEAMIKPLSAALGFVVARSQSAGIAVPAYDNSAMDGYALCCADVNAAGTVLPLSQTIAAGHPGAPLMPGTVARIFTGAPVPEGADAVVMQENTSLTDAGVRIDELPKPGQNIRLHGHDVQVGDTVVAEGQRLRPQDLGLLASLGINELPVYKPLRVAILNTGDEVVEPGKPLLPGQLYDSNSFTLEGLLQRIGMEVVRVGIVEDTLAATITALSQAAERADVVISTGGVSVGDEDHVREAVEQLGELSLWKLAIKPGKPFSYGQVAGIPFFGLPGNPVAVFVTFVMLVRPSLLRMQGANTINAPVLKVKAGFAVRKAGSRQEYLRVRLVNNAGEEPVLVSFEDQGSSIMTSLSWADGLAIVEPNRIVSPGDSLTYLPFEGLY